MVPIIKCEEFATMELSNISPALKSPLVCGERGGSGGGGGEWRGGTWVEGMGERRWWGGGRDVADCLILDREMWLILLGYRPQAPVQASYYQFCSYILNGLSHEIDTE
jgi:hypothetical protein